VIVLGTTGTREVSLTRAKAVLETRMAYLETFDRFITGGCRGWDTWAGMYFALRFPDAKHQVILPSNLSQVERWWRHPKIIETMVRHDNEIQIDWPNPNRNRTYKDRNQLIVDCSDELFYCAAYEEHDGHSLRSGTWQTIRMARVIDMSIRGVTLHAT
jgi:hypothetical protein